MKKSILMAMVLTLMVTTLSVVFADNLSQGINAFEREDYSAAEDYFKEELKNRSNIAVSNYYLGLIEVENQNDEKAAEYFENALKHSPNYSRPYLDLMKVYYRLGNLEQAMAVAQKASSENITLQNLNYESGRVFRAAGKNNDALRFFRRERTVDARLMWTSLYVAILEAEQERYTEAFTALSAVESYDNNPFNTAMVRLMIHEMQNNPKEAEKILNDSEKLYPVKTEWSKAYDYNLAWLYYKQGNLEKAINKTQSDINQNVRLAHQYYNMARIYADLGRFEEAALWVKKAINEDKDLSLAISIDPVFEQFILSEAYQTIDRPVLLIDDYPYNVFRRNDLIHNIESNDTLLVPVFSSTLTPVNIFQRLGIQFDYNPSTLTITARKGSDNLVIDMRNNINTVNGKPYDYKARSLVKEGVIYIPIELICNVFGYDLEIDRPLKTFNINSFRDVPKTVWYYDYLGFTASKGIVRGFHDNTFRPNEEVTVDQFLVMTLSAMGIRNIENASGYWAQNYIDRALSLRIIDEDQFLNYTAPITRAQASGIVSKAFKLQNSRAHREISNRIEDFNSIPSSLQRDAVNVLSSGILTLSEGDSGYFNPNETVSRAAAVAILSRSIDESRRLNVQ